MSAPPQDGPLERVRRALASQAKMRAIKMYREETGSGWAAAAEAVERLARPSKSDAAMSPALRPAPARPTGAARPGVVERKRIGPMLVLLALAAGFGALFALVYLLTAAG